jgi:hypothetical protein
MKKLLLFTGLLLGGTGLFAQQIAVFAKGEFSVLDSGPPVPGPKDPAKAAFLAAYQADRTRPAAFEASFNLSAPPDWGRTVPGAAGTIQFHPSFPGGFVVRVSLEGLLSGHKYILCLNGNPALAGNDRLVDAVPHNEKERYYDFLTVTTDAAGRYQATFGIFLPASPYDVRFYVKDTDDFKIVLYHDYFKFNVE